MRFFVRSLCNNNMETRQGATVPVASLQATFLDIGSKVVVQGHELHITSVASAEGKVNVALLPIMPIVDMLKVNSTLKELKCATWDLALAILPVPVATA